VSEEESPNEFTVILKVLDIMDRSLQKSNSREMNAEQHAQFVQIFGSISGSTLIGLQGGEMGDSYTVGQAGAVGPHSKAENIHFQQVWQQAADGLDPARLADELKILRSHLRHEADTLAEDEAVAEVSKAHAAAVDGDGTTALRHLRAAGKWALDGATTIGATVAAAAIKAALGL